MTIVSLCVPCCQNVPTFTEKLVYLHSSHGSYCLNVSIMFFKSMENSEVHRRTHNVSKKNDEVDEIYIMPYK